MFLFSAETYTKRRSKLKELLGSGRYLFLGNKESSINYRDNHYRFRQDSSFLYFFGISRPNLAALIDVDTNTEIVFGDEYSLNDTIWMGSQPTLSSLCEAVGVQVLKPNSALENHIDKNTHFLPAYRGENKVQISELTNTPMHLCEASEKFCKAIIAIRSIKESQEIELMHTAVDISKQMHAAAKREITEGKKEYEIMAILHEKALTHHANLAYQIICTKNGQYLHNNVYSNELSKDDLILIDAGAEHISGYAGDVTRTWSVSGAYTQQQKEIFEIVQKMKKHVEATAKEGLTYYDMHIESTKIMLSGLQNLGLVKNVPAEELIEKGIAGMFMPHGLGHMIGLDVHDMENLNENWVGYDLEQQRSSALGLRSLRLARKLKTGMTLTVEPGMYFIPDLIENFKSDKANHAYVDFDKLSKYENLGGIRLEDNVVIQKDGCTILGFHHPEVDDLP
ncbi:MAG: aminopeptidase P family protein [Leadbetterella sp.]